MDDRKSENLRRKASCKTVIPFCTSGGSGSGRSGDDLAKLVGTGNWLKGARHSGSISESGLQNWVNGLK